MKSIEQIIRDTTEENQSRTDRTKAWKKIMIGYAVESAGTERK